MNSNSNERKPFASLAGKPPMANQGGLDGAATLTNLTGKGMVPSKWSINIQEIVKRTQKNLERQPASSKASGGERKFSGDPNPSDVQYLSKQMKLGFGSSSAKDKSTLLYHDLKKKLSYDSGPMGNDLGVGLRNKDNLLGMKTQSKGLRPTSMNNGISSSTGQIGTKSLYLAAQKSQQPGSSSAGLHERLAIARLKRRNQDDNIIDSFSQDRDHRLSQVHSANDISATAGSIQGTQGGGEMYAVPGRSIEERAIHHQRTLMQAGRLNLIGSEEPDEEARLIGTGRGAANNQLDQPLFRRHNSNNNKPTTNYSIMNNHHQQEQEVIMTVEDSSAIVEAGITEEQTQRNTGRNASLDRLGAFMDNSLEDIPTGLQQNNYIQENIVSNTKNFELNQLRPSSSAVMNKGLGGGAFTETQNKRQSTQLNAKVRRERDGIASGDHNAIERRQKIFEEEIIKRIKEIQRYVKSLHLQIKKTQAGQEKFKEEVDSDKDVLISLQQMVEELNTKQQNERFKQVGASELEASLKEMEQRFDEKLIHVVQEAADQTIRQVSNEIVPEARLKMYDSITEETNRLKIDIEYQINTVKRELQDGTKKDRLKSSQMIEQETHAIRKEMASEQKSQTLQILAQVDAQISKALKDQRPQSLELPRAEIQNLRAELQDQLRACESKLIVSSRDNLSQELERATQDWGQQLAELESRTLDQLSARLTSHTSQFVTPEVLSEKMQALRQDLTKISQLDTKKAFDSQKMLFVSTEKMSSEMSKMKKAVDKQVKTGLEEAKFDTIQMVQSDILEVANQQKEARLKAQELTSNIEEVRGQFEEAVQRLTNREKEQSQLFQRNNQIQDKQTAFENKLNALNADIRELMSRDVRSPVKQSPLKEAAPDSFRSNNNAFAMEELESIRQEVRDISHANNLTQSQVEETKMAVSNNKSSAEKQLKALSSRLDDISRQLVDSQLESGQNKQFFEDQLSELTQSAEALQTRIIEAEETWQKNFDSVKKEVQKLEQSSDRQFLNLNNGVSLLEEWQAKMKKESTQSEVLPQLTGATQASPNKEEFDHQMEQIQQVVERIQETEHALEIMKTEIKDMQCNRTIRKSTGPTEEVLTLMEDVVTINSKIAQLKEKNQKLEHDLTACTPRQQDQQAEIDRLQKQMAEQITKYSALEANVNQELKVVSSTMQQSSRKIVQHNFDLDAIQDKIEAIEADSASKIESLQQQMRAHQLSSQSRDNLLMAVPQSSSKDNSQQKWQESSIKKFESKKQTSEWTEVRATKIEAGSMRSSNLGSHLVSNSGPNSLLKSVPPRADQEEESIPFTKSTPPVEDEKQSDGLQTPEKPNSRTRPSPKIEDQEQQPLHGSMSFEKLEQAADVSPNQVAAKQLVMSSNTNDYEEGLSVNHNCFGMRKPTEYSASVEQQPTTKRERGEPSEGELEIKSPVQFEMLPESDVKVNETNSSQANLLIQDRIAFDDDNNLNDQIISPSEGIQVPNTAEFYKMQREIRSNQVQKKNDMVITVKVEQEIESEKVDSPRRLDATDFYQDEVVEQKQQQSSQIVESYGQEHQNQALEQLVGLGQSSSGLLLQQPIKGVATTAHLEIGDAEGSQLNDQTQLFRTQKMAGLADLSQKATRQQLEGLDEADLEMEQRLGAEVMAVQEEDDTESKEQGFDEGDGDDDGFEGIPTSAVILGMKLGELGHDRKNSEGKSSMMGLSALGLESHRESQVEHLDAVTDSQKQSEAESKEEMQQDESVSSQEDMALKIISAMVSSEIEGALSIMQELKHPRVAPNASNE